MQSLAQRGGRVNVRVGGNTQDYATLVPEGSIPNYKIIQKQDTGNTNPTETPTLDFTAEVLYLLGNVSALTNVHWYLGESPQLVPGRHIAYGGTRSGG